MSLILTNLYFSVPGVLLYLVYTFVEWEQTPMLVQLYPGLPKAGVLSTLSREVTKLDGD